MILSVLIATLPERKEEYEALVERIKAMPCAYDYEVLTDCAVRFGLEGGKSVGQKRMDLLKKAKGKWIVFVDDDDDIVDDFFHKLQPFLNKKVDVICGNVLAIIDGKEFIIDQSIYHENEQLHSNGKTKRFPSVMAIYRREIALKKDFPDTNVGEDFEWSMGLGLNKEHKTDEVFQIYKFDSNKTVAAKMEKRCVVTFSNTETYNKQAERLKASFAPYNIDVLHFTDYESINSKPHNEYPYAFKANAIQMARLKGYNVVLWCDSPVVCKKSPLDLFDYITENKYVFFDNIGFSVGDYTSDICLAHFGIDRDKSFEIPMIMASVMGFDFRDEITVKIFETYLGYAHTNAYQGSWFNNKNEVSIDNRVKGHRHDQSVMSLVLHKFGVKPIHAQSTFYSYEAHSKVMPIADSVCIVSQGI